MRTPAVKMLKSLAALLALGLCSTAFAGKCTVTEFVSLPRDGAGQLLYLPSLSPTTPSQQVTYTTSTRATTAFATSTQFIRVYCDSIARIAVGPNGTTATANSLGLPAGGWEYIQLSVPSTASVPQYIVIYDGTS